MAEYFGSLDYLDDYVNSRLINISILCSTFAPFIHWVYNMSSEYNNIFALFCAYALAALLVCCLLLVPMSIGNKTSASNPSKIKIYISILWNFAFFNYIIWSLWDRALYQTQYLVFTGPILISAAFCALSVINYCYLLCKSSEQNKFRMYAIQKYHALNTIPIHSRMDNDESTTADNNKSSLHLLKLLALWKGIVGEKGGFVWIFARFPRIFARFTWIFAVCGDFIDYI